MVERRNWRGHPVAALILLAKLIALIREARAAPDVWSRTFTCQRCGLRLTRTQTGPFMEELALALPACSTRRPRWARSRSDQGSSIRRSVTR
jgi:hypothetical protein